ncbi:hypothetical protein [Streptomyces pristinaespiralis]|uniref:hypothetical protein n=1 Tax=Streptomyces pristinaespiralis TaxID=38300 RepID=UPI0038385EC9
MGELDWDQARRILAERESGPVTRFLADFYRRLPHDAHLRADHDLDRLGQECAMVMRRIDRYFDGQGAQAQDL